MHQTVNRIVSAMLLMLALATAPSSAQAPGTVAPDIDPQAMAMLTRMADFLSQTQHFSMTVDIGFDVIQDSGQKIEFGETRQILIRRPDRARIDITRRDGATAGFRFDGQEIAVFNTRENVYATVAKPGSLDDAIDYFISDLDMRFPLAELVSSHLAEMLPKRVLAAYYVEPSRIAGVPCHHLAFRGNWADIQLWIAQGDQPLPRRLMITYKDAAGQPQFRAQCSDWNLAPDVPDSLFVFTPAPGAAKIAFALQSPVPMGGTATTGERQ